MPEIYIVTGYKAEQFDYLVPKYGVRLIHNPCYLTRNNNGSIWLARDVLANSYLCSSDNYFAQNPFESEVDEAYYAAEYAQGHTDEWCMTEDEQGYINSVTVGGEAAWYMMGHTFWSAAFSAEFLRILEEEYDLPQTADKLWETIFMEHLSTLKMRIRRYAPEILFEFDTLDELRAFDHSYVSDTRSKLIKQAAAQLGVAEAEIVGISTLKSGDNAAVGFAFSCPKGHFSYLYESGRLKASAL